MKRTFKNIDLNDLINACKKGDSGAQVEIYNRYYKAMYNISFRILNKSDEAEDVMQESFLNAFQKLDTFKGDVTFGAWLKKIVINKSLTLLRNRKTLISLENDADFIDDDGSGELLKYDEIQVESVREAIMTLPEGYRVVLSLYLIEGYDHEEISQILNISNATSRTQYHRAKKQLAKKLKENKAVS